MTTYTQSENGKEITKYYEEQLAEAPELQKFDVGQVFIEAELESSLDEIFNLTYLVGMHAYADNGNGGYEERQANLAELEKEVSQRANINSRFFLYDDNGEQNEDITIITNCKKGITVCRITGSTFMDDELNG